jgi:Flp pilus assembly pilin Flp
MRFIKNFVVEEEGAEVVEWALLVVVIGLAVVLGGPTLTGHLQKSLDNIGGKAETQSGTFASASTPSN